MGSIDMECDSMMMMTMMIMVQQCTKNGNGLRLCARCVENVMDNGLENYMVVE